MATLIDKARGLASKAKDFLDSDPNTQGFQFGVPASLSKLPQKISNSVKQYPTPASYFAPKIGNAVANAIQGPVSPIPSKLPAQIIRNTAGQTVRDVSNRIPDIGTSMLRASPPGQLYEYAKPLIQNKDIETYQPQLQRQQRGDLYNSLQGIGLTTQLPAAIAGGAINVGMQGVMNKVNNKPFLENADTNFSKGLLEAAPIGPLSALNPIGRATLAGKYVGLPAQKMIPTRFATKGLQQAFEGAFLGAIEPGETKDRLSRIKDYALFGAITGALTQAGGDMSTLTLSKLSTAFGKPIKTIETYLKTANLEIPTNEIDPATGKNIKKPAWQVFGSTIDVGKTSQETGNQSQKLSGIEAPTKSTSSNPSLLSRQGIDTPMSQPLSPQGKIGQAGQQLNQPPSGKVLSPDEIIAEGRQKIKPTVEKVSSFKESWKRFYTDNVNRFQPVEDIVNTIEKKTNAEILPQFSPKTQIMRLQGAGGTAELRHRKVLDPILKQIPKEQLSDFDVYLKARRDIGFGKVGREITGSDPAKAQEIVNALGTKYDLSQWDQVAQKLYGYQDQNLQRLLQEGFIDQNTFNAIKGQNPDYVPFQRVMDDVDNFIGLPTKRLSQGKVPVNKIEGSEHDVLSPVESIIADTYKMEAAIAKNRVAKSIGGLSKILPDIGINPLRKAENVIKRIDIYKEAGELGIEKNKIDRLLKTRNRWARVVKSELNKLNTMGMDAYLKRGSDSVSPQMTSGIQVNKSFIKPDITTDTGDVFKGPASVTNVKIKDLYVQPSEKEVKQLVNDLVNNPPDVIALIKKKIATRENKLGGFLDEIESLRSNVDALKQKRGDLFDEAKLLKDLETKGKDYISVWNKGIKEYYEVPKDVSDVVKGLNEEQQTQLVKLLSIPANILRQGATGRNIDFMIPNVIRDQFDAAISSKYGYRPFIDYFNGLAELVKYKMGKPSLYEDWANSGGKIFYEMAGGRKAIASEIQDATRQKSIGKKFVEAVVNGLDIMGEFSETPTRLGLFKRTLEKTGNKFIAASESREGTLDFARMGAKMKTLNAIIPFFNVGIQGFDKLIRTVKDRPGKVLMYGTLYGVMPQIALTVYNNTYHPEEYKEIPDEIKQDNFVFVTGRTPEGKVSYRTMAKGNILPYITNPVDNILSAAAGYDRQKFSDLALTLLGEALPVVEPGRDLGQTVSRSVGSVLPQAFKPAIEDIANYNFYRGKEIVPSYLKNKAPIDQSYSSTELPYKYLGNVLQVSPLRVKNFIEGTVAGTVKTPLQLLSIAQKMSRGELPSPNEIPVLRRFISETYDTKEQYQEKQQKQEEKVANDQELKSSIAPLDKRLFGQVSAAEEAPKLTTSIGQLIQKETKDSNMVSDYKDILTGKKKVKDVEAYLKETYGVTSKEVERRVIKNLDVTNRSPAIYEILKDAKTTANDLNGLVDDAILTDAVAKEMYSQGIITEQQQDTLRKYIAIRKNPKKNTTGKKGRKRKQPSFTPPTPKLQTVRQPRYKKLTLRDLYNTKPRRAMV